MAPRWLGAWEHTAKPAWQLAFHWLKPVMGPTLGRGGWKGNSWLRGLFPAAIPPRGKGEQAFGSGQLSASVETITENSRRCSQSGVRAERLIKKRFTEGWAGFKESSRSLATGRVIATPGLERARGGRGFQYPRWGAALWVGFVVPG